MENESEKRAYFFVKAIFDFLASLLLFSIFLLPMVLIAILIRLTSKGPAIHWSKRIGSHNREFLMPKFRTMKIDAPQIATHLLQNSASVITPIGGVLRKTSLDEIPQVWSVLVGQMSLVGPRPALFNQYDLIELRTKKNVHILKPGITGWAQINGRDELPIAKKVEFDAEYLSRCSLMFDLLILVKTFTKVVFREGVRH